MEGSLTGAESRPGTRRRRAMSAVARPNAAALRPGTASSKPRRPYSAYTKRAGDEDTPKYDEKETNREWWRFYLKDTPIPGTYRIGGFIDDLKHQPSTYRFRDSSRAKSASHQKFEKHGSTLLPGAYEREGFVHEVAKRKMVYGFNSVERDQGPKIGHGCLDKDMNTSPLWYDVVDYSEGVNERNAKTADFKSDVKRDIHSAHQFRIVRGPGPGRYEGSDFTKTTPAVSSSFKSQVPRFSGRPSKTPGPGTYSYEDSVFGQPKPIALHRKKKHSLTAATVT